MASSEPSQCHKAARHGASSSSPWTSQHDTSRWEERHDASGGPGSGPGWSSSGEVAEQKVFVIGDSMLQGLEKMFQKNFANKQWRVDVYQGSESLTIPCSPEELHAYDHIFYCSAGNGIWKGDDTWNVVQKNICSFDPQKVSIVLLGSAKFWSSIAPGYKLKRPSFFADVRDLLQEKQIRFAEVTSFMEELDYADAEGHPSKNARWELAPKLLQVFQGLSKQ